MNYTLKNDRFEVVVSSFGAQLCAMKSKANGRQYLWCADETVWGKTSPVLFPYIGRVRDSYVKVGESVYAMTKHGFARNCEFEVEAYSDSAITLLLRDNDFTRSIYPFSFEFRVQFILTGATLETVFEVKNTGTDVMHFALGGHTGYSTEIDGARLSDYKLVFEKKEHFNSQIVDLAKGLLTGGQEDMGDRKEIELSPELFDNRDTLVFSNISNKSVKLVCSKHAAVVEVEYKDFPNLAIWAAKGTERFVCIEPWIGHTDTVTTKHTLARKESFAALEGGKTYRASHSVTITE